MSCTDWVRAENVLWKSFMWHEKLGMNDSFKEATVECSHDPQINTDDLWLKRYFIQHWHWISIIFQHLTAILCSVQTIMHTHAFCHQICFLSNQKYLWGATISLSEWYSDTFYTKQAGILQCSPIWSTPEKIINQLHLIHNSVARVLTRTTREQIGCSIDFSMILLFF